MYSAFSCSYSSDRIYVEKSFLLQWGSNTVCSSHFPQAVEASSAPRRVPSPALATPTITLMVPTAPGTSTCRKDSSCSSPSPPSPWRVAHAVSMTTWKSMTATQLSTPVGWAGENQTFPSFVFVHVFFFFSSFFSFFSFFFFHHLSFYLSATVACRPCSKKCEEVTTGFSQSVHTVLMFG